jgi:hypothetical protein
MNTTPQVNDKFRFDNGTIGTITGIAKVNGRTPAIKVNEDDEGFHTFAIADLTLYQAPITDKGDYFPAMWTVKDEPTIHGKLPSEYGGCTDCEK